MNLLQELKNLDTRDVGRWPLLFRAAAIGLLFIALTGMFIYLYPVRQQMPDLELAGPVERLRSNFVAGIKHMPVRFSANRPNQRSL